MLKEVYYINGSVIFVIRSIIFWVNFRYFGEFCYDFFFLI